VGQIIPIFLTPFVGFLFDRYGKRMYYVSGTAALYVLVFVLLGFTQVNAYAPLVFLCRPSGRDRANDQLQSTPWERGAERQSHALPCDDSSSRTQPSVHWDRVWDLEMFVLLCLASFDSIDTFAASQVLRTRDTSYS
jgi:MFS family permease